MAKRKTTSKRSNTRAKKAPAQPLRLTGTANDIVGLLLVVLAVALMVALLLPSSAPVTRTCGEVLVLCFGSGALLFPAALLAFAAQDHVLRAPRYSHEAVGLAAELAALGAQDDAVLKDDLDVGVRQEERTRYPVAGLPVDHDLARPAVERPLQVLS